MAFQATHLSAMFDRQRARPGLGLLNFRIQPERPGFVIPRRAATATLR